MGGFRVIEVGEQVLNIDEYAAGYVDRDEGTIRLTRSYNGKEGLRHGYTALRAMTSAEQAGSFVPVRKSPVGDPWEEARCEEIFSLGETESSP